jgi:hypothetical protein
MSFVTATTLFQRHAARQKEREAARIKDAEEYERLRAKKMKESEEKMERLHQALRLYISESTEFPIVVRACPNYKEGLDMDVTIQDVIGVIGGVLKEFDTDEHELFIDTIEKSQCTCGKFFGGRVGELCPYGGWVEIEVRTAPF